VDIVDTVDIVGGRLDGPYRRRGTNGIYNKGVLLPNRLLLNRLLPNRLLLNRLLPNRLLDTRPLL
jgi:hypothetical protein